MHYLVLVFYNEVNFIKRNNMKKIFLAVSLLSSIGLMANDALKAEMTSWLAKDHPAAKAKYDSLSQDKQKELDSFFESCRADVASGKLPKGTCKPALLEKLK